MKTITSLFLLLPLLLSFNANAIDKKTDFLIKQKINKIKNDPEKTPQAKRDEYKKMMFEIENIQKNNDELYEMDMKTLNRNGGLCMSDRTSTSVLRGSAFDWMMDACYSAAKIGADNAVVIGKPNSTFEERFNACTNQESLNHLDLNDPNSHVYYSCENKVHYKNKMCQTEVYFIQKQANSPNRDLQVQQCMNNPNFMGRNARRGASKELALEQQLLQQQQIEERQQQRQEEAEALALQQQAQEQQKTEQTQLQAQQP